jgi:hypothetical protein
LSPASVAAAAEVNAVETNGERQIESLWSSTWRAVGATFKSSGLKGERGVDLSILRRTLAVAIDAELGRN